VGGGGGGGKRSQGKVSAARQRSWEPISAMGKGAKKSGPDLSLGRGRVKPVQKVRGKEQDWGEGQEEISDRRAESYRTYPE